MLGVVRTLTSATRLLDVLPLLRPQDGIEVYYTINPGSAFTDGLTDYLDSLGVRVLPWRDAVHTRFDLAVACTVNASMRDVDAPLVVLPHGAGYNRLVTETTGDSVSAVGLSRRELLHEGAVVPAMIGLSHPEQLTRLAHSCPEALPCAVVVGDPCFDRATHSVPLRDRFREQLGAVAGRRLVVVNSTWSEHSLLGRHPDLPLRLVSSLPVDEFAVALITHPNVWARHGRQAVYERLAEAMDAGLMVIDPREGWRATLIAGDWVIGDHGSTTFYGAALGHTTLLAAAGLEELDPTSPTAEFARRSPRLDPSRDLYQQLLDAERRAALEGRPGTETASASMGVPGESAAILRERLYAFLAPRGVRPPPDIPRPRPVPRPEPVSGDGPTTYDVEGWVTTDGEVALRRFPVVAHGHRQARGFYVVTTEETHPLWPQSAEVVVRTVVGGEQSAVTWAEEACHGYPGAQVLVAALGDGFCLVRLRGGELLEAHVARKRYATRLPLDPTVLGAAVHTWLVEQGDGAPLPSTLTVRTGHRAMAVRLSTDP